MADPIKIVTLFLLATVKYFYSPAYGLVVGLSLMETTLAVLSGGVAGFFLFYYLTDMLLFYVRHLQPVVIKVTPTQSRLYYRNWKASRLRKKKNQKIFTRRNKLMVKARRTYGMWGIALLTPVALSIPLGSFLLRRYYGHRRDAIPVMLLTIIGEGLVITFFSWLAFGKS